jgi:hypothetical protein
LAGIAGRSPTSIRGWRERIGHGLQLGSPTINQLLPSLEQCVNDVEGAWLRAKAGCCTAAGGRLGQILNDWSVQLTPASTKVSAFMHVMIDCVLFESDIVAVLWALCFCRSICLFCCRKLLLSGLAHTRAVITYPYHCLSVRML